MNKTIILVFILSLVELVSFGSTVHRQESGNPYSSSVKSIAGTVKSADGEIIIGATVKVKDNQSIGGVVTDINGKFELSNVTNDDVLVVSYLGYDNKEIKIGNRQTLDIVLDEEQQQLKEVVVVGYGSQSRNRTTGSISQIKSDKIANIPVVSFEQAIAGQLPGVQVMQQSGAPGSSAVLKVRGASSITAGTNPLVVIDGFPSSSDDFSNLNPDDIESINVLKDASSSAIYGSRGANGVIIVTTKKGSLGKPQVTARLYYGIQETSKKIDLMDAYEYAEFVATARNNYWVGLNPGTNNASDANSVRNSKSKIPEYLMPYLNHEVGLLNTDWQDEIFRTAAIQQYGISIAGGSEKISYYTSLDYQNQDGVIKNSGFKRLSARSNLSFKLNKNVSVDFNVAPTYSVRKKISESNHKNDGVLLMTLIANPAAAAYNDDGSLKFGDQIDKGQQWGTAAFESPLATALSIKDNVKTFNLLANAQIKVNIIDNLNFLSHFGIQYDNMREEYFRPSYLGGYNSKAPQKASGKNWTNTTINWVTENTLDYKFELNDHYAEFLAGFSAQREDYESVYLAASDFPNDNVTTLNAGIINDGYTKKSTWTLFSYFARANYVYKNRYLLSASVRRDGSSRFGKNNKFGTFPSVSLGWRMTEEKWMENQAIFSDLKLRASYGVTGNFQIPNYSSYSLLKTTNYVFNNKVQNGLAPSTAPSPNIGWEKTTQWNVGVDLAFLRGHLSATLDYYHSKTQGLLLDVPVPGASGFTTSLQNIGKVQNNGFEMSIKADVGNGNFKWNPSFNFSSNKSKVLQLGPDQDQILSDVSLTKIGGEIGAYYLYNVIGVFKSEEDLAKYPHLSTAKVGSYIYEDVDDDHKITDADRKIMGSYNPDFTIGFNNSFTYKNFDLSMMLQWVQGVDIMNKQNAFLLNEEGWGIGAKRLYNNWFSETNPNAKYAMPRVSPTDKLYESSNLMMEDGSYLRINNITLGYSLPKKLINRWHITNLRVYVTAHNPFTFTNYTGYNPEASYSSNPLTPGIDYGGYPVNKSVVFGLNINL